jgi:hypothetical protein
MIKLAKHIIGAAKEIGVLRTIGHGVYQAGVFVFCQLCGLVILGPRNFFRNGPIN